MEAIQTHPSNAAQAKAFTAPGSLSFPGGANEIANPAPQQSGAANNGAQQQGVQATNGSGVTPATPAATPGAGPAGPSGITPTLQNIVATVNLDCRLDLKTIALHARNAEVRVESGTHHIMFDTWSHGFLSSTVSPQAVLT
ncbi:hypothetical protein VTJ49DRAFT_4324 [Mycothermus thermophilus]|uniref:Uncharacterized protein n=1 Tax=Humicola insolens TaxID=85995 RepID=A0ABR3V608_HUMIN